MSSGTASTSSQKTETSRKRQANTNVQMPQQKKLKHDKDDEPGSSRKATQLPYSEEQRAKLCEATAAQKDEWRCSTCSLYFHKPDTCTHKGPVCFRCFEEGHIGKNCKNPIFMPKKSKLELQIPPNKFRTKITAYVDSAANSHVYLF